MDDFGNLGNYLNFRENPFRKKWKNMKMEIKHLTGNRNDGPI